MLRFMLLLLVAVDAIIDITVYVSSAGVICDVFVASAAVVVDDDFLIVLIYMLLCLV